MTSKTFAPLVWFDPVYKYQLKMARSYIKIVTNIN